MRTSMFNMRSLQMNLGLPKPSSRPLVPYEDKWRAYFFAMHDLRAYTGDTIRRKGHFACSSFGK